MRDYLPLGIFLCNVVRRRWSTLNIEFPHAVDHLPKHTLHSDTWVLGVANPHVVTMEVDSGQLGDFVSEACGIKI